jgi:transcriptional antiterminator NusG
MSPETDWFMARRVRGTDAHALSILARYGVPSYYPKLVELRPMPQRRLSHSQRASGIHIQMPVQAAMFPGYVLVQIEGVAGLHKICSEAGLGGFACAGEDEPLVRIRPNEMARMRSQENGGLIDGKKSLRVIFQIGDEVTVTSGPFASFPGVVEKGLDVAIQDLDPTTRIKVAINLFGRRTPADLEVYQVAKRA